MNSFQIWFSLFHSIRLTLTASELWQTRMPSFIFQGVSCPTSALSAGIIFSSIMGPYDLACSISDREVRQHISSFSWPHTVIANNVTKSSLMSMWKPVWEKTKYSKFFITKLEQGNTGPGESKLSLHLGKKKKKKGLSFFVMWCHSSVAVDFSSARPESFLSSRATQQKVKKYDQGKESTH